MSQKEQHIDLFDNYQRKRLSETDRIAFKQRLKTDIDFSQAFDEYISELNVIKAIGAGEEMMALIETHESKKQGATLMRYFIPMGIAAALALLFFVLSPSRNPSNRELFDEYFEPFPNLISARDNTTLMDKALRAYSLAEYKDAIIEFEKIDSASDTIYFYKSLSHLSLNQPIQALKDFNLINPESSFYQQSIWYRAIAHLLIDENDSVRFYLEQVDLPRANLKAAKNILKVIE